MLFIRVLFILGVIVTIVALLFRDRRRTAEERALLIREMQAARSVQQVIVPEPILLVPGLMVESAYEPAGEVGGDACGFVCGHISHARALHAKPIRDSSCNKYPDARANTRRLHDLPCCSHRCGRHTYRGKCRAPRAIPQQQGVHHRRPPLGLSAESTYPESAIRLTSGAHLTLLADGVVEARSAEGELFGFERTAAISTQSADEIALAAQHFAQNDDITVLTLAWLGAAAATP